ncbi:MAG: ATP-binding cassette domain-containing protein, partial [Hyphomicrobiales bacterium]|nr:ATP-binding cassette domain-containing protein [Hyphomicrobiales bacterium]
MIAFDLSIRKGDFALVARARALGPALAVCGPSGAGKTSLLDAIAGLDPAARGRVEVDGVVLQDDEAGVNLPAHRRRIGYVFQDARLFPHLGVAGNL